MVLARERALELHKQMWSDMQKELGDSASCNDRLYYKDYWCESHFPNENIYNSCFLCEYSTNKYGGCGYDGELCIIDWGCGGCTDGAINCYHSPISEILALPERKIDG